MLHVVGNKDQALVAQLVGDAVAQRAVAVQGDAEGGRDGGEDVGGIADDIEGDEEDTGVDGRAGELVGDREGKGGFAHPARAGEGDDPIVLADEQIADRGDFAVTPYHRVGRHRGWVGRAESVQGCR